MCIKQINKSREQRDQYLFNCCDQSRAELNKKEYLPSIFDGGETAICAGIWGLSVSMGNQFSIDYLVTVGPILMISIVDPHRILIPIKCWKKQPSNTSVDTCAQKHNFFWPKCASFFPCDGKLLKLAGIDQQYQGTLAGVHLSQPITPKCLHKCDPKNQSQFLFSNFCQ